MTPTPPLPWKTATTQHRFGPFEIALNVISDFDAVLDHCAEMHPDNTNMIPYYAHLWESAEALGQHLVDTYTDLSGKRVLELGCGLGLPSILSAKLNATVVASDFHPDNQLYFERNAACNGVASITYQRLDWAAPNHLMPFDMIIGSDLLYESQQIQLLTRCVKALLKPNGSFTLADPGRDHIQAAVDMLAKQGFTHTLKVINDIFIVTFQAEPLTSAQ